MFVANGNENFRSLPTPTNRLTEFMPILRVLTEKIMVYMYSEFTLGHFINNYCLRLPQ